MNVEASIKDIVKVACPYCGKALPVRILEFSGKLRYSVRCNECKRIGEVTVEK